MTSRKLLGFTSLMTLSFGLMAGCSSDSNPGSAEESSASAEVPQVNACAQFGDYYATPAVTGEILCYDAAGTLTFWINADGSFGVPTTDPTDTTTTIPVAVSSSSIASLIASSSSVNPFGISSSSITNPFGVSSSSTTNPFGVSSSSTTNPFGISSSSTTSFASSSSMTTVVTSSASGSSNGNTAVISYASSGASINTNNGCVTVNGGETVITCAGDYDFSGSYSGSDAQIRVYSPKADSGVYLNLRGLTLTNSADAPIYVQMASKTFVVAKSGTTNTLTDGSSRSKEYSYVNNSGETVKDTTNAAIYSKDDLTLKGEGSLKVTGNYNNGIQSSNDLRIKNGEINVTAKNNGLKGKGSVQISGGTLTIAATSGDGIKSDDCTINGTDTTITEGKGIVNIQGGSITITKAGDDGIQAYNQVVISDSTSVPTITVSSTGKGIVSDNRVYINAGTINVTSGDDGVHSNLNVYFNGGYTTIKATGNDGVHADSTLYVNNGTIYVSSSYEGLEAWYITISGGVTDVYGTDDGWNAAGGSDASGNTTPGGSNNWGWMGAPGGNMGGGSFGGMGSSSGFLTVTGGIHHVKTGSGDTDGIDSNGDLTLSGGVIVVECQINGGQGGSFDSDGNASLTSKTIIGFSTGSSEEGNDYTANFSTSSYYGNTSIAFKPSISGSHMQATNGQPSAVSNTSSYQKSATFPSGGTVYYN